MLKRPGAKTLRVRLLSHCFPIAFRSPLSRRYVGNLSPFVTDQALREIFQAVGPLREVKIIRVRLCFFSLLRLF